MSLLLDVSVRLKWANLPDTWRSLPFLAQGDKNSLISLFKVAADQQNIIIRLRDKTLVYNFDTFFGPFQISNRVIANALLDPRLPKKLSFFLKSIWGLGNCCNQEAREEIVTKTAQMWFYFFTNQIANSTNGFEFRKKNDADQTANYQIDEERKIYVITKVKFKEQGFKNFQVAIRFPDFKVFTHIKVTIPSETYLKNFILERRVAIQTKFEGFTGTNQICSYKGKSERIKFSIITEYYFRLIEILNNPVNNIPITTWINISKKIFESLCELEKKNIPHLGLDFESIYWDFDGEEFFVKLGEFNYTTLCGCLPNCDCVEFIPPNRFYSQKLYKDLCLSEAPELDFDHFQICVAKFEANFFSKKNDIWSFGMILLKIFSNSPEPFFESNIFDQNEEEFEKQFVATVSENISKLLNLIEHIPLRGLIKMMLNFDLNKRPSMRICRDIFNYHFT